MTYTRALTLVRLHTQPLGLVELPLRGVELTPLQYADLIWQALADEIISHLTADSLPVPERLPESGLTLATSPMCLEPRRALIADAPFVSIVVPSRDGSERLASCLRSLLACDYPRDRYEIIVVDNVPRSCATANLIQGEYGDVVRYVREGVPGGASARNRGLRVARGDIVAFVDDDVVVDEHWLAGLAGAFTVAPDVGCVTQLILPLELETLAQLLFEEYGGAAKGFVRRIYHVERNVPDDPLFPFNAGSFGSGGGMAFNRAILERLGGFDPALGNGVPARSGEDLELFLRTIVEGYTLVYEPAAILRHRHVSDYSALRDRIYAYGVGLTALILRSLVARPNLLPRLLKAMPDGVAFALSSRSTKHAQKSALYPAELRRAELAGMLFGPIAYIHSARRFGWPAPVDRR